jgi:hypothetical protein
MLGVAFVVMLDVLAASIAPFLLIRIVDELNAPVVDKHTAYTFALALSLLTLGRTLVLHMAFFNAWRVGQGTLWVGVFQCVGVAAHQLDGCAQTCARLSWAPCTAKPRACQSSRPPTRVGCSTSSPATPNVSSRLAWFA